MSSFENNPSNLAQDLSRLGLLVNRLTQSETEKFFGDVSPEKLVFILYRKHHRDTFLNLGVELQVKFLKLLIVTEMTKTSEQQLTTKPRR